MTSFTTASVSIEGEIHEAPPLPLYDGQPEFFRPTRFTLNAYADDGDPDTRRGTLIVVRLSGPRLKKDGTRDMRHGTPVGRHYDPSWSMESPPLVHELIEYARPFWTEESVSDADR